MKRSLAAAVLTAAMLCGCAQVQTASSGAAGAGRNPWTRPGVLRMADLSYPDSLNPLVGNYQIDVDLSMFWAGYFFNYNDKGEFVPELATEVPSAANGGVSKDGLTFTYHLRPGVLWHDGKPFTADDVIFTWHAIMNPKNNITNRLGYDLITRIDKRDDHTSPSISSSAGRRSSPRSSRCRQGRIPCCPLTCWPGCRTSIARRLIRSRSGRGRSSWIIRTAEAPYLSFSAPKFLPLAEGAPLVRIEHIQRSEIKT